MSLLILFSLLPVYQLVGHWVQIRMSLLAYPRLVQLSLAGQQRWFEGQDVRSLLLAWDHGRLAPLFHLLRDGRGASLETSDAVFRELLGVDHTSDHVRAFYTGPPPALFRVLAVRYTKAERSILRREYGHLVVIVSHIARTSSRAVATQ